MRAFRSPVSTIALLILTGGSGCTAVHSTVSIHRARQALEHAEERGASEQAPYEYTMAEEYLRKAREENHGNAFRISSELARTAMEYADLSIVRIEARGVPTPRPQPPPPDSRPHTGELPTIHSGPGSQGGHDPTGSNPTAPPKRIIIVDPSEPETSIPTEDPSTSTEETDP